MLMLLLTGYPGNQRANAVREGIVGWTVRWNSHRVRKTAGWQADRGSEMCERVRLSTPVSRLGAPAIARSPRWALCDPDMSVGLCFGCEINKPKRYPGSARRHPRLFIQLYSEKRCIRITESDGTKNYNKYYNLLILVFIRGH